MSRNHQNTRNFFPGKKRGKGNSGKRRGSQAMDPGLQQNRNTGGKCVSLKHEIQRRSEFQHGGTHCIQEDKMHRGWMGKILQANVIQRFFAVAFIGYKFGQ